MLQRNPEWRHAAPKGINELRRVTPQGMDNPLLEFLEKINDKPYFVGSIYRIEIYNFEKKDPKAPGQYFLSNPPNNREAQKVIRLYRPANQEHYDLLLPQSIANGDFKGGHNTA